MQYRPKFLKRCFQRLRRTFFCSVTRNSSWDSGSSRIFSTSLPRRSSGRQDLAVRSRPAHPVQAAGCAAARVGAGDLQRRVPGYQKVTQRAGKGDADGPLGGGLGGEGRERVLRRVRISLPPTAGTRGGPAWEGKRAAAIGRLHGRALMRATMETRGIRGECDLRGAAASRRVPMQMWPE